MTSPAPKSTTDLYLNIDGVGSWSTTIPYDLTAVGPTTATDVLEACLGGALGWFMSSYLPLRFTNYAQYKLGYTVLASTWKKKQRRARTLNQDANLPNVWSGTTRRNVVDNSYPETRAIGGRRQMKIGATIRFKTPAYVNAQRTQITNRVLSTITNYEGQQLSKVFFKNVADMASRFMEETTTTRRGKLVTRTVANQMDAAGFRMTNRATILNTRKREAANAVA